VQPPVQSSDPVADLRAAGAGPGTLVALALAPGGVGVAGAGCCLWFAGEALPVVRQILADLRPRVTWWAAADLAPLVRLGLRAEVCWDAGAVHRLLHGGSQADPAAVWAVEHGLDPAGSPRTGQLDLLGAGNAADTTGDDPVEGFDPVRPDGYLRPGWAASGPPDPVAAAGWAGAVLAVASRQRAAVDQLPDARRLRPGPPLPLLSAWSESAADVLAVELGVHGLPLDRGVAGRLLTERVGPPPTDAGAAEQARVRRDAAVLDTLQGAPATDLRNPADVRALLTRVGIQLPDTRSWRLEPFRGTHPFVDALLTWRKTERIATTYGWTWLERHVGSDGRLRGSWTGCDGGAGRMTASAGLHNLPAELRPAVVAEPGHLLVRADLGQVEPRVLAAISGDDALASTTADLDLYAPVAARLRCDRPTAKVAVLAAMYGQTSGAAGEALRGLERAYPVAMGHLRAAEETGRSGGVLRTYGGRLLRLWPLPDPADPGAVTARGRFARNAVVQGAAAELFKMWAVSVRAALPTGADVVLCLHDELLVHAPRDSAEDVAQLLREVLGATAARWAAGSGVRFVADVAVIARWSDAKS